MQVVLCSSQRQHRHCSKHVAHSLLQAIIIHSYLISNMIQRTLPGLAKSCVDVEPTSLPTSQNIPGHVLGYVESAVSKLEQDSCYHLLPLLCQRQLRQIREDRISQTKSVLSEKQSLEF